MVAWVDDRSGWGSKQLGVEAVRVGSNWGQKQLRVEATRDRSN